VSYIYLTPDLFDVLDIFSVGAASAMTGDIGAGEAATDDFE
jgi:hypothetical protein